MGEPHLGDLNSLSPQIMVLCEALRIRNYIQNMSWLVKINLCPFQDRRDLMKETYTAKWTVDVLSGHFCTRESTFVSIAGRLNHP